MDEQAIEKALRNLYVDLERSKSYEERNDLFASYAKQIANMGEDVVSVTEAAAMLGLSRQRVHVLLQNGQLLGFKTGNVWNVYTDSVKQRMQ